MSVKNMRQNIKDDQHVLNTLMNSTLKTVHLVSKPRSCVHLISLVFFK